ncbi:nidogen-1 [Galendromus occidentalis]|uniref:Nidogen-1 n=1 Tax=Galendromus occidentalis TaxID=34638 RepID=A0AAJ6QQ53_9ACAR|nr:nidogen-1 [Galendromus occidentalis]
MRFSVPLVVLVALMAFSEVAQAQVGPCTRANMKQPTLLGQETWQCDSEGLFLRVQCHPKTGFCCCVEPRNGKCLKNTEKAPGTGLPQC